MCFPYHITMLTTAKVLHRILALPGVALTHCLTNHHSLASLIPSCSERVVSIFTLLDRALWSKIEAHQVQPGRELVQRVLVHIDLCFRKTTKIRKGKKSVYVPKNQWFSMYHFQMFWVIFAFSFGGEGCGAVRCSGWDRIKMFESGVQETLQTAGRSSRASMRNARKNWHCWTEEKKIFIY